jgi:hypothetical protein
MSKYDLSNSDEIVLYLVERRPIEYLLLISEINMVDLCLVYSYEPYKVN